MAGIKHLAFILSLIVIVCCTDEPNTTESSETKTTLSTENVTAGNIKPPTVKPYLIKNGKREEEKNILTGWYTLVDNFLKSVSSDKDIIDKVIKFVRKEKNSEVQKSLLTIAKSEAGILACIIFGFLYLIILPIVGLIFFCCRMCGKCGGNSEMGREEKQTNCFRNTYATIVFVLFIVLLIPLITMFVVVGKIDKSISTSHDIIINTITDLETFANSSYDQISYLVEDGFDNLIKGIISDTDNATVRKKLGIPIKDEIVKQFNIEELLSEATNIAEGVSTTLANLGDVNTMALQLKNNITNNLEDKLNETRDALEIVKSYCNPSSVEFPCNLTEIKLEGSAKLSFNFSSYITGIKDVAQTNLASSVDEARNKINDIPGIVTSHTETVREDMKKEIGKVKDKIDNLEEIKSLKNLTDEFMSLSTEAKDGVDKVFVKIEGFKKYINYGGFGVCGLICVILIFILLGVIFGVFGHKKDESPSERSTLSTCGCSFLLSAVGIMFIFGSLLMIVTTLLFTVGSHGNIFICDVAYGNLSVIDKLKDKFVGSENSTNNKFVKDLSIARMLEKCEKDKTIYKAMDMATIFNISEIKAKINDKISIKIDENIKNIKVDLTDVNVLPDDLRNNFETYKGNLSVNFTSIRNQLNSSLFKIDLKDYIKSIDNGIALLINKSGSAATIVQDLKEYNTSVSELQKYDDDRIKLSEKLVGIENDQTYLQGNITSLLTGLEGVNKDLSDSNNTKIKSIIENKSMEYKDMILIKGDTFIATITGEVENNVAKCQPIWNVFDSARFVVCKLLFQPLNSFWFALGWILAFFIPAIVFSVKLSRHYRTLEIDEDYSNHDIVMSAMPSNQVQLSRSGKVHPSDYHDPRRSQRDEMDQPNNRWMHQSLAPHPSARRSYNNNGYEGDHRH